MNNYKFDAELHCHTLNGKPLFGASTVVGCLSKPLTWWASARCAEVLGWTDPKKTDAYARLPIAQSVLSQIKTMDLPEYLSLLDKAYKAHSVNLKKTAKAGIDLHSELERYIKWHMSNPREPFISISQIQPFVDWTNKNVKHFLWSEAHCFSSELWVGGISDFGCELNDESLCVGDFKSSKAAYTSHFLQDALYALCIEENGVLDKNGNEIWRLPEEKEGYGPCTFDFDKLIVVPFGAEPVVPIIKEAEEFKEVCPSLVEVYKFVNREG